MAGGKTANALRTLNLTLNLANTEVGLTREQLGSLIDEYGEMEPATFQRTFERDLGSLREAGLITEVLPGEPPRYRLSGSSFPAPEVAFGETSADLLAQAATAWSGLGRTDLALLLTKLGVYAQQPVASGPSTVAHNLEGIEVLPQVLSAIEARRPLHFVYASRTGVEERDVAPWSLIFRGGAVYLTGFDLNRWGPRQFRLSRIQSSIDLVGEAGDYEVPEGAQEEFESGFFRVRPLLWVKRGRGALIRLKCGQPIEDDGCPAREGWDLLWGEEDDQAVWEQLILDDCLSAIPVAPTALRQRLQTLLEAAATWDSGSDQAVRS